MDGVGLADAVRQLAEATHGFSEAELGQPWRWRKHDEGVRFALIGAYHELCELAVRLAQERADEGPALTVAQRALAPYQAAYRDLQLLLLGVDDSLYDEPPAPGEWALRDVLAHMVNTQRTFFTLVHYGLARQRSDEEQSPRLPEGEVQRVVGDREAFIEIYEQGTLAQMWTYFERLHRRTLRECAEIGDDEIRGPSVWWEGEPYDLQYRIHRMDAHLRQHTIQVEKTLQALEQPFDEARRLLRLVYRALADVEATLIGAPALGREQRQALAERIVDYAEAAEEAVSQAGEVVQAVQDGDAETVQALLDDRPELANAVNEELLPVLLDAVYRGHEDVAQRLVDAGVEINMFAACALGEMEKVQELVAQWDGYVNEVSRDGFTPLQLACFFGHEPLALWLMDQGATIDAVAQNGQRIQPIHAASARGNVTLVQALLERGADANARQQQAFTPLHAAAQSGNVALAELLLKHGADVTAQDAHGRTPGDVAKEAGQEVLVAVLEQQKEDRR